MKNLLLLPFLALSVMGYSQATTQGSVGVFNDAKNYICTGGDIPIGFRFKFTPQLNGEESFNFYYQAQNLAVYPCTSFKCKEFFGFPKTVVGNDTIYWFTAIISPSVPLGTYMVQSSPSRYPGGKNFGIYSCVGIEEYQLNSQIPVYYDLRGNKIDRRENELIIEQVGLKRRKIFIQK